MARNAKDPFSKYVIDQDTGCWNWSGAITKKSYGNVHYMGRWWKAHRLFYTKYIAEIEAGDVIMHACDNPRCVNPDHLKAGSQRENIEDCIQKNRHALTKNGLKITADQAAEIYRSTEADSVLAKRYGVSRGLIWKIRKKKIRAYK